jgi:site-specific DNA-cytosine methylase
MLILSKKFMQPMCPHINLWCVISESGIVGEVKAAMDINTIANKVYKHNFPNTKLLQRNIQSLSVEEVNGYDIDMILMSPPCQPFTR